MFRYIDSWNDQSYLTVNLFGSADFIHVYFSSVEVLKSKTSHVNVQHHQQGDALYLAYCYLKNFRTRISEL